MSRIKAIIYTSSDPANNLVFENEDILAISTNTKCIEKENLPEFDIFPNSGTLTVKDRNLNIYNKARSGYFDNYEYKVEYYLENEIIATHIINQRPKYDYDAKTCTFYLGNILDSLANQTFTPYDYPLESQTLDVIFENVLKKIFSIADTDYEELMNNVWGNSSVTFAEYFQQINITYPYISETKAREALKTILLISQCGMYLDKNNKLKLIRLDGYSNASADEYYNNVYKIEPRHMNKGFVPSVILDNKFNQINLNYFSPKTIVNVNSPAYVFQEESLVSNNIFVSGNGFSTKDFQEEIMKTYTPYCYEDEPTSAFGNEYYIRCAQVRLQRIYQYNTPYEKEFVSVYQNNNLKEIISLLNEGINWDENPSIIITCKKIVETSNQAFWAHTILALNGAFSPSEEALNTITTENYETFNPFELTKSFTININDWAEVPLNITIPYQNSSSIIDMRSVEGDLEYHLNLMVCSGIKVEILSGSTVSTHTVDKNGYYIPRSSGVKQIITYLPVKIDITYNGTVKEIVFDESSYSKKFEKTQTISYENTLQSSLELNEKASFINQTNTQEVIATNLLSSFNQGLHTGTLTVANTNYDFVNPQYETVTQPITFKGQEKLYYGMPVNTASFTQNFDGLYETINGKDLSTSSTQIAIGLKDIEINDVSTQIKYKMTAKKDTSKKETIITIEFDFDTIDTNINTLKFDDINLPATIKKLINTNKKLFEIGDKVMPYKDKPIINRVTNGVEEPVVFQIVDCETFNESGATFQNLVLREIKKPKTT